MLKLRTLGLGALGLVFILGISLVAQLFNVSYAATSLSGDNEVITVGGTTDGLAVNAAIYLAGYSADGNIVVFSSSATNLPNAAGIGLYSYNIRTNQLMRIDVSTAGVAANQYASSIKVSETGRYISFTSSATNLLDSPYANADSSVYMRDTQTSTTTRTGNGVLNSSYSRNRHRNLGVSNDGRFHLAASRYINNTYPYYYRIVVGDANPSTSGWTTLGVGDGLENSSSATAVRGDLNCDGSFAIFEALRTIYSADLRNSSSPQISVLAYSGSSPVISCNGRYMLYTARDQTITPTPTNIVSRHHLIRYDRITGEKMYIDSNSLGVFSAGFPEASGSEPIENMYEASVADTGDVVFKYNNNVYLKHLGDGSGTLESIAKNNVSGNYINIQNGGITRDGRYVYFQADPTTLGITTSLTGTQIIRAKTNI